MTSFSLKKTIPSCEVHEKLLLQLEKYVRQRIDDISAEFSGDDNRRASISSVRFADNMGVVRATDVCELNLVNRFPPQTDSVSIYSYKGLDDQFIEIEVRFSISRSDSYISISHAGFDPREKSIGIYSVIREEIDKSATKELLTPPSHRFVAILIAICIMTGILSYSTLFVNVVRFILSFSCLGTALFLILTSSLPYCWFDSVAHDRLRSKLKWWQAAVVGYVVFSIGIPIIAKYILNLVN